MLYKVTVLGLERYQEFIGEHNLSGERLWQVHLTMKARRLRHGELVVLRCSEIACVFVYLEMVTDNLCDVHVRIIPLVGAVNLTLALQGFFVHVSHEVVDTFIVVNEEEILKLSLLIDGHDDLFFDGYFSKPPRVELVDNRNF